MPGMHDALLARLVDACQQHHGSRLVSLAVYGSVGRGTARSDSDIDLLIVADPLPDGRVARSDDFRAVDDLLAVDLRDLAARGITCELSPVFKTPAEVRQRSLLFLDMTEDARLLFDRDDFLAGELSAFAARLRELGARRHWRGDAWFWDLKPDYRPGEVIDL